MKKYSKIILAGGTGQLGNALCHYFKDITESIVILSRTPGKQEGNIRTLTWDGVNAGSWAKELDGADILVNLAGKNVNCRYTGANKKAIIDSRVNSIKALASAVKQCTNPPGLWIQSASATIYRHAEDKYMDEETGELGKGFSVDDVCKVWEGTFWEETQAFANMRKAILRISLVLSPGYGLIPRLKNLVRFGLGGAQGNGKQMVSWIHEKDVAGMVDWIASHPTIEGIFNCTSPYPVTNADMMRIVRKELGMPFGLPASRLILGIGAFLIRTETELVLKSRWVLPGKIVQYGYTFGYPRMESAMHNVLKNN